MTLADVLQAVSSSPQTAHWTDRFVDEFFKSLAVAAVGAVLMGFYARRYAKKRADAHEAASAERMALMESRLTSMESELRGPRGIQDTLESLLENQKKDHDILLQIQPVITTFNETMRSLLGLVSSYLQTK